jgi:hypothetical protein
MKIKYKSQIQCQKTKYSFHNILADFPESYDFKILSET